MSPALTVVYVELGGSGERCIEKNSVVACVLFPFSLLCPVSFSSHIDVVVDPCSFLPQDTAKPLGMRNQRLREGISNEMRRTAYRKQGSSVAVSDADSGGCTIKSVAVR